MDPQFANNLVRALNSGENESAVTLRGRRGDEPIRGEGDELVSE